VDQSTTPALPPLKKGPLKGILGLVERPLGVDST